MGVEALVQEDQIDQAVVENKRLLRSYELQEKSPNALALVLVALREGGLVSEPQRAALGACWSRTAPAAPARSERGARTLGKASGRQDRRQRGGGRGNAALQPPARARLPPAAARGRRRGRGEAAQAEASRGAPPRTLSSPLW